MLDHVPIWLKEDKSWQYNCIPLYLPQFTTPSPTPHVPTATDGDQHYSLKSYPVTEAFVQAIDVTAVYTSLTIHFTIL